MAIINRGCNCNMRGCGIRARSGTTTPSNPNAMQCTKCSEQRNRELAEVLGRLGISINEYAREFGLS